MTEFETLNILEAIANDLIKSDPGIDGAYWHQEILEFSLIITLKHPIGFHVRDRIGCGFYMQILRRTETFKLYWVARPASEGKSATYDLGDPNLTDKIKEKFELWHQEFNKDLAVNER